MARALRSGIIEVPNSSEAHAALAQLDARLARLESARLVSEERQIDATTRALFINYGTAILSVPDNEAETTAEVFEYAALQSALVGLCGCLQVLKITPRRIFSLEDFNSQIIARALAHQLKVDWSIAEGGDGFTHSKSLIVSADNRALHAQPLRTVFPSQVVYALNLKREGGFIMPDVAGVFDSKLFWPWHEEKLSNRKISGIVERIVSQQAVPDAATWPALLEFYRARRALLSAGNSSYSRLSMLPEDI